MARLVDRLGLGQDAAADGHHGIGGEDEGAVPVRRPRAQWPAPLATSRVEQSSARATAAVYVAARRGPCSARASTDSAAATAASLQIDAGMGSYTRQGGHR